MAKVRVVKGDAAEASAKNTEAQGTIKLTLVRSPIGYPKNQKATVRALGLTRMHQVIEKADTPENRSMAGSIPHLIQIVE